MEKIVLYHGTLDKVFTPIYGKGNRATNLFKWATPKEYGVKRTPPRAQIHKETASESLALTM